MNNFVDTVRHDAVYSGYAVSCAIGQKLSGEHWRLQLKAFIEDYQLDTTTTGELCPQYAPAPKSTKLEQN